MNSTNATNMTVVISKSQSGGVPVNPGFNMAFRLYLPAAVLITGVVTNSLVLAIMRTSTFNKLPLSVYFSSLVVSDTVILLQVAIRQILDQAAGIVIYRINILCTIAGFLLPAASMTSSWFVVCIAVERFLVVKYPMKAKKISTKKKAVLAVVGISSVSALLNSPSFWMEDYSKPKCVVHHLFEWYYIHSVRSYIFLSTYNVIPLLIISCCYIMVVWILKKKQQQVLPHSGATVQKLTTAAIMICLFFTILTMPITISLSMKLSKDYRKTMENTMFHDFSQFLRMLNYGTNFFIYMWCNVQFKLAAKRLFGCGADVNSISNSGGSTEPGFPNN